MLFQAQLGPHLTKWNDSRVLIASEFSNVLTVVQRHVVALSQTARETDNQAELTKMPTLRQTIYIARRCCCT